MAALINYLKLDSVNVLGWSDGGNTGLIIAMKYPDKVKRLATMGANIFIDKSVVDDSVFRILHRQLKELKGDTAYVSINRSRLIKLLLTEPNHSFKDLHQIKCPVFVMAGEKDVIRENHTKQIADNIPNSQLMIFPKATHYIPWENSGEFNQAVLHFFLTK